MRPMESRWIGGVDEPLPAKWPAQVNGYLAYHHHQFQPTRTNLPTYRCSRDAPAASFLPFSC